MNRIILVIISLLFCTVINAQSKIQFRSADKAECVKSDFSSLKASFSFSELEAQDYESARGTYSWLSMPNTVLGGNEGDPQIPVINELIAVPLGAKPRIEVTSFSSTEYRLADYGIHTLVPRQPSLRKDKRPEDVPFVINEDAYQARGLRSEPRAMVSVEGVMRGVQLGKMTIEPVSYDPVGNTLRVFNDIEVTVHFDGADAKATEQLLVDTYSPYFDIVYKQLFNDRAILDMYTQHPDLYTTPVKMLVVTTSTYANSTAFQNWLTWKKQKGIYVDVQTVANSASASTIKSTIYSRYNATHPTFLVIVGDETVVTYYSLWDYDSSYGNAATDLEYASVDGDVYHDMFISRMSVSSTTELNNLVNKILTYEKYTMSDPSYLSKVLLIAGADATWAPRVGRPTINYAADNYYNTAHGFTNVYKYVSSTYTGCYNYLSSGVGFANYTAHGDIQEWYDPNFTNSNVNSLTNNDKYFWAMGNCCLTCNFKNAQNNQTCFGEAMIRAANKGAFGYIGSVPESYWWEDYYFGVGATTTYNSTPTQAQTKTGVYDAIFDESGFNTLNAVPFIGNVAVSYAHAGSYSYSVTDEYYWRAYQCFGDGSVMPYRTQPAANSVSHASILPLGATSFNVSAVAGSYVAITVNNEIIGVAQVPSSGSVNVPITAQTAAGNAMIVVTRNQRQPYIATVQMSGEQHTITVVADPEVGGTVTGGGSYYEGTPCTLTATANHGYVFSKWKKGNAMVSDQPSYTFTVSTDATYTAEFTQLIEHSIIPSAVQHGSITINPTTAYAGDIITLSATPSPGYCFQEWQVTTPGKQVIPVVNNQFVMPDSDVTVNAIFSQGHTVTVAEVTNGSASVDQTFVLEGTAITLSATPDPGYCLGAWVVNKTGDVNTTVTVTGNQFIMPAYDVTVTALFIPGSGGEINIGSGSATSLNIPTNAYYNYSLTQQIYTAEEIGESSNISAIAFKVNNSRTATRNLDIYLKHTDKTAFSDNSDWETLSVQNKVFSGNVEFISTDWTVITLSTPFSYDGTSNLLVCVNDKTGDCTDSQTNTPKFLTFTTGGNRALHTRNDDNSYTPESGVDGSGTRMTSNNQIILTKQSPSDGGSIIVSTGALEGFTYIKGQGPSEAQHFGLIATGSEAVVLTAPNHYEISQSSGSGYASTLSFPGATVVSSNIYVRLKDGLDEGSYNETLTIQCGETSVDITLNGEVTKNTYYTFDGSPYSNNIVVMAVIQIEGEEQRSEELEIGAFCGDECRGAGLPMYCPPVDRYILPLVVYGTSDDVISFKLYDHVMEMESELTTATTLVFNEDGYGSIFNPVILNFATEIVPVTVTQTFELTPGWHWWTTFVEMSPSIGLEMLEQQLGSSASMIKSNGQFVSYANGKWTGQLTNINNESCYLILVEEEVTVEITGEVANTETHPVAIVNGWNWVGYPCQQTLSLSEVFANFTPSENDMLKTQNGFTSYSNGKWNGALTNLKPGEGFLYLSNSGEPKVLVFPSGN